MAIVHFVNYKRGTQSRAAMRGVMLYVMQEKKTAWEGKPLVSGINCQPQSAYDDFLNTKLLYHKDGGVMFYHMVQSFPKGAAVDPRQAHEAARRLAEYFDGCEVLVCTHVDREHIHSHCVINSVNFAPVRGKYKIYIIDEVHMLTTAAFNALLKTLEATPAHVNIVLCTTDPQKILETILSRCQRFDFHRIGNEDIERRLAYVCEQEGFDYDDEALAIVARHAKCGMRDALSTL